MQPSVRQRRARCVRRAWRERARGGSGGLRGAAAGVGEAVGRGRRRRSAARTEEAVMATDDGCRRRRPRMARWQITMAARLGPTSAAIAAPRRAPAASRPAPRRRTPPRAPENARLATVAKPCSSARRASSRWAMRSADGRSGSVDADAPAVHPPPARAHEQRAGLADEPRCRGARARARRPSARAGRAPRGRRGRRAGRARSRSARRRRAARGPHDVGAALGVERRDDPGVRERRSSATGAGQRLEPRSAATAVADERHDVRDASSASTAARGGAARARRRAGASRRPRSRGGPASAWRPHAAGDRQAQDHECRRRPAARVTCSAWPSPVVTIAK